MKRGSFLVLTFLALVSASQPALALSASEAQDFLVQNVCVDDSNRALIGVAPGDPRCTRQRDIRQSDRIPYHLVARSQAEPDCSSRRVFRDNLPFERNGTIRAVGAVTIDRHPCAKTDPYIPAYLSVRAIDDAYMFIMGTWTRTKDGGRYGGGVTPFCNTDPNSSERYFRNWVLAKYSDLIADNVGYYVAEKKGAFTGLSRPGDACPAKYPTKYIAFWTRGTFRYGNGMEMDTIVSHPYSQVGKNSFSPGAARQMERTYWTKEFGQTRWENWKREDFFNRKAGMSAIELAEAHFNAKDCSRPFQIQGKLTDDFQLGEVIFRDGYYSQDAMDLKTGENHRWIMVNCQETTGIMTPDDPSGDPFPDFHAGGSQFWDFWK